MDGHVPEATFEQAYQHAKRAAEIRSKAAAHSLAISPADREDVEQEALIGVWLALPRFRP